MEDLSKKILDGYQTRKTKKQKSEFIDMLTRELEAQGHQVKVETSGIFKSRNIVVGDLENCKVVLGAHYDTAPVLPFPNFLMPKNILGYLVMGFALIAVTALAEIGLLELVALFTDNMLIPLALLWAVVIAFMVMLFGGKPNQHTANDNTSGVITLVEALSNPELAKQICCVFFDHEEIGLFGSMAFAKKHKKRMKEKLLFNFDCVSDGDTIMLVVSKRAKMLWWELEQAFSAEKEAKKQFLITKAATTFYPSDQMNFRKTVGVAAFKRRPFIGYYMDRIHTKRDVIFEEENIQVIVDGLKKFMKVSNT